MSFLKEQFGTNLEDEFGTKAKKKKPTRKYLKKADEEHIYDTQEGKCANCGRRLKIFRYKKDHKKAVGLKGPDTPENIQLLCSDCHDEKTRKDRAKIAEKNRKDKAKKQKQKKDTIEML